MKPHQIDGLYKLFLMTYHTKDERPDIPPTREELANLGVDKKTLKFFETKGWCKTEVLALQEGKISRGRVVYILTPDGYSVCKEIGFVEPKVPKKLSAPPAPKSSLFTPMSTLRSTYGTPGGGNGSS